MALHARRAAVPQVQEPHPAIAGGAHEVGPIASERQRQAIYGYQLLGAAIDGEKEPTSFAARLDGERGPAELPLPTGDGTVDEGAAAIEQIGVDAREAVGDEARKARAACSERAHWVQIREDDR